MVYFKIIFLVLVFLVSSTIIFGVTQTGGGSGSGNNSSSGLQSQGVQDQDLIQDRDQIRDPSTHTTTTTPIQDQDRVRLNNDTSGTATGGGDLNRDREQFRDRDKVYFELEKITFPASTSAQLKLMIQNREQELNREIENGTTTNNQSTIRNMNQVRLAVHALLSAENLLGGIGPQVSQIAKEINNLLRVTVSAEENIATRGFWLKFLLGGDRTNATTIKEQITQNTVLIERLKQLVISTNLSQEVWSIIQENIKVIEAEQVRLSDISDREQSRWGLFSWRF